MLGIIIGVAAVITMVALGTGAQRAVDEQINQLGTRVLSVMAGQSFWRGVASANRVSLTVDDYEALGSAMRPCSSEVVPELSGGRQIKFGNKNLFHDVVGTTTNFPAVHAVDIDVGAMFTEGDLATRRRVVVLGSEIPQNLEMAPENLIGRTLTINRIPFEIIGVFEEVGQRFGPEPDDRVFIPLTTAELRVFGQDRLRGLSAQVADDVSLEMGMVDIERVLRREHKIRPGQDNDFMIMNRRQFMEMAQASTEIFAFLLASIAGVSLLVGGIGIMNIMLVSVTERTREIGVRKALGATRFNILMQFVIEALTIGARRRRHRARCRGRLGIGGVRQLERVHLPRRACSRWCSASASGSFSASGPPGVRRNSTRVCQAGTCSSPSTRSLGFSTVVFRRRVQRAGRKSRMRCLCDGHLERSPPTCATSGRTWMNSRRSWMAYSV